jgi:hypothetical protein
LLYLSDFQEECPIQWIGGTVLVPLQVVHGSYVIAYLNSQTRQWNFLEFAEKIYIWDLDVCNGSDLIVCTSQRNENEQGVVKEECGFYNLPIQ